MAFIDTVPASEATGEVREMYAHQQDFWGYVPDYAKIFCYRPEVMRCWSNLLAAIKRPVDERRVELATFAAANTLKHSPCSLAHGSELARMIGNDAVIALAGNEDCPTLTAAERAVVSFARQVARDASQIAPGDIKALKSEHGLTDAEIFDIAAIAASRAFFTKLLDALGVDADRPMGGLEEDLREALVVGRPISAADPERLEP